MASRRPADHQQIRTAVRSRYLSRADYQDALAGAGFTQVSITPAQQVAGGLHSAVIRATRPPTVP